MASESYTSGIVKSNSQSNNRHPLKRSRAITKEIFNSEAKFRVKDMLDKALQLRQNRLNIEQAENTIDLDDGEDFKEAPRFKKSLRLNSKSASSSSSSITNVCDVIVVDAESQPHGVVHTQKTTDKLLRSEKDRDGCQKFTQLKDSAISFVNETTNCGSVQRSTEEKEGAMFSGVTTDQVKDCCRMCRVCGKIFDLLAFKTHSIDCLKQNFSKPDRNKAVTEDSIEQVKCHVCNKNITYMNSQRRQQHVNSCIDKEDITKKEEVEHQQQIEIARTAVLNCPMCGKTFKVQSSRQSHLKKCALNNKMTVEQVKNLVKQQEEEHQSKLNIGILPENFIPVKAKPLQGKHPSASRLRSQLDEDTQLALALSTSLAEDQGREGLAHNRLLGNINCEEHVAPCGKGQGKGKKAKATETASLLVSLSREEAMKRISDRLTRYTFPPNPCDSVPATPPFKIAHKGEFKSTSSAASSSAKSCMQVQPDWWSKASHTMPTEDLSLPETSSDVGKDFSYYVKELMPPVSLSSVVAGSKVKRLSCIPGRRKSGELERHLHTVAPTETDRYPDSQGSGQVVQLPGVTRSWEIKQHTGIVDTGLPATISPVRRFVSKTAASSPLSQTVDVLAKLAMESDLDNGESICNNLSNLQPDTTDDSDDGECTVEPSGFCKESPIKVQSDSNYIITSYLGLVNCPNFSDLVIMTDRGAEVYAHKNVLHARCPELLNISSKKGGRDVVDLTAFSKESILCFLKYVYTGQTTIYSSCQADVKQLAERFSVAELKAATSVSDMGSLIVGEVHSTRFVNTRDIEADEGHDRSVFDDGDWLDVFQTQRDNMSLKPEKTSTANGVRDAQSGSDCDIDADVEEEEERNCFNNNEWQDVFQTQQDNLHINNNGDHDSRSSEKMELTEEVTENVNEEVNNSMTDKCKQTAVESDIHLTCLKTENGGEDFHTVSEQFCRTKYNSSGNSKDLHMDENSIKETDAFVSEEEKVQMLPQILTIAENNESKTPLAEMSDEDIMILDIKDTIVNMLFTNDQCKNEILSLEDSDDDEIEDKNIELIVASDETEHDAATNKIQNVIKSEINLELSSISCLENMSINEISMESSKISLSENASTNETSLQSSRISVLENSSSNDGHLKSSTVNILKNLSPTCVNISTDEAKNASLEKSETVAGSSKPRKQKKTRVTVKEFKNIVRKALSRDSDTCQPLADLTDEDIKKIQIKIEQGLRAVRDPNDSVYIPSVLEDTGESNYEVIITHADVKTSQKQNHRQGKKFQVKSYVMSPLFVEHLKTLENSALLTQGASAGNTLTSHGMVALQADPMQSSFLNRKTAAQISSGANVSSAHVPQQKMSKDPSVVAPISHDQILKDVQMQIPKATLASPIPLTARSGASYVARLLEKCVKSQTKPCSSQSLNNSKCVANTAELVGKEWLSPVTLSEDVTARTPSTPSKTSYDVSIDSHDDILRNCHSKDSATITSSSISKLLSPSAKSTNSGYISGEELFTDSEEDQGPFKTQATYKSPSNPSWILSTQQILCSPAEEESVDMDIMDEVKFVRRNIFLQELAGSASMIKTPHSTETSTSVPKSSDHLESAVTQSLASTSTAGNTVKDTRLENTKENLTFKKPYRNLTSSTPCVSNGNNSTTMDSTQMNMLIDLSLHLLQESDSTVCVKKPNTASDKVQSTLSPPAISSVQTNKDARTVTKKITELATSPEANTYQAPAVCTRYSRTTEPGKQAQSSTSTHCSKATDSQVRSISDVTVKAPSVDSTTPCPVKQMASDDSFHLPTISLTTYCHLRKSSHGPERQKSAAVMQSSLDECHTVITSTDGPSSLNKHVNSVQSMHTRQGFSKTSSRISRSSKNTESHKWTAPLAIESLVPVLTRCSQSQSHRQTDTAESSGQAGYSSDPAASVHTSEHAATDSACDSQKSPSPRTLTTADNNASAGQAERKPAEQNMLSVQNNEKCCSIPASVMFEQGVSPSKKSKRIADKTSSEGTVSNQMVNISCCVSVSPLKVKQVHQGKTSWTREQSDSSDLDSPLPLRKRLGLINPFQAICVQQPAEVKKKAASTRFLNPESSIPKKTIAGQNGVHCTSMNNQDMELGDDDDLLCKNEAYVENMQAEISEKRNNTKVPKQQTTRKVKNVKKAGKITSPFTPMAPYDDMATPDLKKAVSKIGVRPLGKKRMRELLKRVYHETHQYETDSDYDGTPVKHRRSSSQPVQLSSRARLSHLPIRETYAQPKIPLAKKAKSNKVSQTEKTEKSVTVIKHKSTNLQQKSRSQPHTQAALERRTLGNEGLSGDDCGLAQEDSDKDHEGMSGSQDSSFSNDEPDHPEESILQGWPEDEVAPSNQVQSSQQAVSERLVQFIKSNPDVYESVLMYEPLALDVLKKRIADSGIKVSMALLMDFLDDRYITFTMKNMGSRNNNRHRRPQKSGRPPSKSKALSQQLHS